MSAYERRGLRLGLLVVILMSVALAIVAWSLYPLGGAMLPALWLWLIRPEGMRKAPRLNRGALHPKG